MCFYSSTSSLSSSCLPSHGLPTVHPSTCEHEASNTSIDLTHFSALKSIEAARPEPRVKCPADISVAGNMDVEPFANSPLEATTRHPTIVVLTRWGPFDMLIPRPGMRGPFWTSPTTRGSRGARLGIRHDAPDVSQLASENPADRRDGQGSSLFLSAFELRFPNEAATESEVRRSLGIYASTVPPGLTAHPISSQPNANALRHRRRHHQATTNLVSKSTFSERGPPQKPSAADPPLSKPAMMKAGKPDRRQSPP
ncbi:hypothetical protein CMUS01_08234 [Colletotrichum musicola]|uniref:Uncharacterized protein n=1 Tax=Colletotrichum musicola TaxID=2175873 RepID=A0A8H6NE55_9PEZI|nr:hypothetical protein CMUS01_08234 [Colletotrichum musicola]